MDESANRQEPEHTGRRERHKAAIRERLFRAAIDLYMTRGLQATTVRDITEAADVGKGTFFNYFPTKEHVVAEHYGRQSRHAEEALEAVRAGESYREAMARARRRLWHEARSPAFTRSFLLALVSNQSVFDMALPHLQETRRINAELIAIGQTQGEVRTDFPAADLARALQHLAFGSALFWLCQPESPLEDLLLSNVDLLLAPRKAQAAAVAADRTASPILGRVKRTPQRKPAAAKRRGRQGRSQRAR
jgi:AcrR family transcriptional regulator